MLSPSAFTVLHLTILPAEYFCKTVSAPSPPSEKGISLILASGRTLTIPFLIAFATSVELKFSLNESGIIRIRI